MPGRTSSATGWSARNPVVQVGMRRRRQSPRTRPRYVFHRSGAARIRLRVQALEPGVLVGREHAEGRRRPASALRLFSKITWSLQRQKREPVGAKVGRPARRVRPQRARNRDWCNTAARPARAASARDGLARAAVAHHEAAAVPAQLRSSSRTLCADELARGGRRGGQGIEDLAVEHEHAVDAPALPISARVQRGVVEDAQDRAGTRPAEIS